MTPDEYLELDDWLGCGVDSHAKDCLCDVKVSGPEVPIRMKNLVTDLKHGEIICEIRGYGLWDDASILGYLTDVVYAHDEIRSGRWKHLEVPIENTNAVSGAAKLHRWKFLRETVSAMLQSDRHPTIREVLDSLGSDAREFTSAVTTNKFVMDAETLDEFEKAIHEKPLVVAHVAKRFGLSADTARNLVTYWGILPPLNWRKKKG